MNKMNISLFFLTCADAKEAEKISQVLLKKRLVACIKKIPISSSFLWKGEINNDDEIMLIMDSREELFEEIEKEIAKHHSYDKFVLVTLPISKVSQGIKEWLEDELKN
ncbi:divalent cation tolerance protein CutA [Candidatus Dojkabacteria bacterium]|nr:divalent cation tolerance protein CutA [Candidatus Dojkabacteria bacterium]